MQAKIIYVSGETSTYDDVETIVKIVCQGLNAEFWQLHFTEGRIVERRAEQVAEIICK